MQKYYFRSKWDYFFCPCLDLFPLLALHAKTHQGVMLYCLLKKFDICSRTYLASYLPSCDKSNISGKTRAEDIVHVILEPRVITSCFGPFFVQTWFHVRTHSLCYPIRRFDKTAPKRTPNQDKEKVGRCSHPLNKICFRAQKEWCEKGRKCSEERRQGCRFARHSQGWGIQSHPEGAGEAGQGCKARPSPDW